MLKFGCITSETNLANDHFLEILTLTLSSAVVVVGPGTFFRCWSDDSGGIRGE